MMLDVPHGKGTIVFGNGFGGGIQRPERNDKYEGEFDTGFAHGLAQYTHSSKGKLFKGEYNVGQRHGCGAEYDMNPFLKKVKSGVDPATAWEETKDQIEGKARYGRGCVMRSLRVPMRAGVGVISRRLRGRCRRWTRW